MYDVPIKLSENVPSLLETQCYVQVPCRMRVKHSKIKKEKNKLLVTFIA